MARRVPIYGTRRVFAGYRTERQRVPRMVERTVIAGYDVVEKRVPKYGWVEEQDGCLYHHRHPISKSNLPSVDCPTSVKWAGLSGVVRRFLRDRTITRDRGTVVRDQDFPYSLVTDP